MYMSWIIRHKKSFKETIMKEKIKENWDKILNIIETECEVPSIIVTTWIGSLEIYDIKDNTIFFYVDERRGKHGVEYLLKKGYDQYLLSAIRQVLNNSDIDLTIDEKSNYIKKEDDSLINGIGSEDSGDDYMNAVRKSNLNEYYTFENFVPGDSNKHALATCLAIADMPSQDNYNPLFLYGGSGLGKTHLIQSIAHYIIQHDPEKVVLYVTSEKFTNEIITAIQNNNTEEFRAKYRKVDILIIDDIQEIIGRERTQIEFFNTFNYLYEEKKQIILSSDRPPKEFNSLDERLRSRFEWGVPIDIHEPDYETRMAILHKKAENRKLTNIPEEVFKYIAENIVSNVRELEGALNKISIFANLTGESITVELAQDTLKDLISKETNVAITPELILKVVSEHTEISENDIKSKKKNADIALARQIVMYLCRTYTDKSLHAVGEVLGGKNHATIIAGVTKITQKINTDPQFKASIDVMVKKINPSENS